MGVSVYQPCFTGSHLDRNHSHRKPATLSLDLQNSPNSTALMIYYRGQFLCDSHFLPAIIAQSAISGIGSIAQAHPSIYLGQDTHKAQHVWAIDVSADEPLVQAIIAEHEGHTLADLRYAALKNPPIADTNFTQHPFLAAAAQAKSILSWHHTHGYCAKCGTKTHMAMAGYERHCPQCKAIHHPRTDPVVIMLAIHKDTATGQERALIGRTHETPAGIFSALAGFVEPGETIEEAVRRELYEEAGIKAGQVHYVTSQPWPWPSSLMIACLAECEDDALTIDSTEIETAFWITKDDAKIALKTIPTEGNAVAMAPPLAVAHQLMRHWLSL